MRLTQAIKKRIVDGVLSDIPTVDIKQIAQDELRAAVVATLPPKVKKVWDDQELRQFIKMGSVYTDCGAIRAYVPTQNEYSNTCDVPADAMEQFRKRCGELREQREQRDAIKARIEANLAGCATRKQLVERFPELEPYCPAEAEGTANLPATTDFIDSLKAAGWTQPEKVAA